jgi:hypothetical protein
MIKDNVKQLEENILQAYQTLPPVNFKTNIVAGSNFEFEWNAAIARLIEKHNCKRNK